MTILPKITNKQKEILTLLYKFRFLNRIQIQTFLNHKYPLRINKWLKDLTEKEYLNRIYSNKFGENTKPAVYFIGINGIRFLKTREDYSVEQLRKLYREKERSETFISTSILLADICLDLSRKTSDTLKNAITTMSDFADVDSPYHFLTEYTFNLIIEQANRPKSRWKKADYLLEIFGQTLPPYSVRKRIRNYIDFYNSSEWEAETKKDFPTILVVAQTKAMMIYAKRYARKLLRNDYEDEADEKICILYTYEQKVKENGIAGDIWEK